MNNFLNGLKDTANLTYTENGARSHKSTKSNLLDMFSLGGSCRSRSEEDCILLFKNALAENETYALKCLFYIADCRGGAGERRFFRVCFRWLAQEYPELARRNMKLVPEYRRWDDLYCLVGTSLEADMFDFMREQLALDVQCNTPSLLAKWLKSINASSPETRTLAMKTAKAFGMNYKQYRKTLAILRQRINVLERLMSEGRWDEIEYDKIPSRAGLVYKNAFAKHDLVRYQAFMENKETKVNANVLNPADIAAKIFDGTYSRKSHLSAIERAALDKYWANLKDYYNGREENGIAVVDVSGSMTGTPMNAAVSMGAYIAERGKGPFKDHFITFSDNPQLVKFEGVDITDKFLRARDAGWGMSTNIEATMDLLLNTAVENHCSAEEIPQRIYIFSDMEFNGALTFGTPIRDRWGSYRANRVNGKPYTLFEQIEKRWKAYGYEMPNVIFWNLDARQNNIPALGDKFSYVSGFSMSMIEAILSGKTGYDLMMEKLDGDRYSAIK